MAANQLKSPSIVLGYLGCNFSNDSTLALSAAGIWLAMGFVPSATKTLLKARIYLDTKTGTPANTEMTADLFSDASGIPNASTEGPISADSAPASGSWMQWTFAGTSVVTINTQYWLAFKNTNASPGSNFPTYRIQASGGAAVGTLYPTPFDGYAATAPMYGWAKVHTVNSGAAWGSSIVGATVGLRLEYTDGTFEGMPVVTQVRPSNGTTGDRAFGTQEVGVRFNIPAGVTFNAMRVGFPLIKVTTPGDLTLKLWQGATLLDTATIAAGNVTTSTGGWYHATFATVRPIVSTNQPFRVTFGDATAADANTKGYNSQIYTWENDANSLALKPMNGTLQKTITADNTANPVVFTDTATDVLPFALLLDTGGELTGAGGGGSVNLLRGKL